MEVLSVGVRGLRAAPDKLISSGLWTDFGDQPVTCGRVATARACSSVR